MKRGTVYLWSSMTLHGTKPTIDDLPKISLRYTIKKNNKLNKKNLPINRLLNKVKGKLYLKIMRDDVKLKSKNLDQLKFNKILK